MPRGLIAGRRWGAGLLVWPLLLGALAIAAQAISAQDFAGAAYLGGQAGGHRQSLPVRAAGALLALPRADGRGSLQLRPTLPLGQVALAGDLWLEGIGAEGQTPAWSVEVQRLRASWAATEQLQLAAGYDLINQGVAYIWNPSNPFADPRTNNQDRAFPYHREGDPFSGVTWLGERNTLALTAADWQPTDPLYGPDIARVPSLALRWDHLFRSADLALTLARREQESFGGIAGSVTIGERLVLHAEAAVHDRRRTLLPVPVRLPTPAGERLLYRLARADEDATTGSLVIGGQYTFANLTNVILEYFHDGEGYSGGEFRGLRQALGFSAGQLADPVLGPAYQGFIANSVALSGRMRRNYLFGRLSFPDLGQALELDLNLFLRWGLDDGARVAGLVAELPLGRDLVLRASAEYFGGPAGSEASLVPWRWTGSLALTLRF